MPDCDKPAVIVGRYRAAVPSGSYLVISHAAAPEHDRSPAAVNATHPYSRSVADTTLRTRVKGARSGSGL